MRSIFSNMEVVQTFDIGDKVVCDYCNDDYSNSDESGGFIFGSKAYCPKCEGDRMRSIKKFGEERFIKATCPRKMSFKDFVLNYRGGNNKIVYMEQKK